MRELGVEEWDPTTGRIRLFPTPAPVLRDLTKEEQDRIGAIEQRREELFHEQDEDARSRRFLGASGGIREIADAMRRKR